jgi:hypothetical protein
VRRLVNCAVVIGLVVLGPAPTSICSLLSPLVGECTTAASEVQCASMGMNVPSGPTVAASSASCCVISQAPLPESRNEASKLTLHEDLGSPQAVVVKTHSSQVGPPDVPQIFSPPPLRSLLCTFLI